MTKPAKALQMTPVPCPPDFVDTASRVLVELINQNGWSLSIDDMELTPDEIAGKDGLLPLVFWRAGQTLSDLWGPQDLTFRASSKALLGVEFEPNAPILPPSIWLHAIAFEVERAQPSYRAPGPRQTADLWVAKWREAARAGQIKVMAPAFKPTSGNASGT